jgi:tetratricopeptide (TPR) repeat protein
MARRHISSDRESTDDAVADLRHGIARLRRATRFVRYRDSFTLAHELEALVNAIEQQVLPHDPDAALELAESFLRTDDNTLGRADDSSGSVGDVYGDAARLWLRAAAAGLGGNRVERLLAILADDPYGTRDPLLREADILLSEHELRRLAAHFEDAARRALAECPRRSARGRITSSELLEATSSLSLVAEALRDPALYERSHSIGGPLNHLQLAEVARRYIKHGRPHEAIERLRRISESARGERWWLLAECYEMTGQDDLRLECLWRMFEESLDFETFEQIAALTPSEQRAAVRRRARAIALDSNPARVGASATAFLLAIGAHEDAERLMARHLDDLAGAYYTHLLRLAEAAAEACQPRVEILCYRRLMLDVLETGRSKIYRHAARYLARLERLDAALDDYRDIPTHADFVEVLRRDHGRKYAFWRLVERPATAKA